MGEAPELELALLADRPDLIPEVGRLRWQEWGYGADDLTSWIDVTAREAGRDSLPVTVVAVDPDGRALGAVGLDEADDELNDMERRGHSPWVIGTVVRHQDRGRQVGRRLILAVEQLARARGYGQAWVATGDEAADFYRKCGWQAAERLRLASTGIDTTVLTKNLDRHAD